MHVVTLMIAYSIYLYCLYNFTCTSCMVMSKKLVTHDMLSAKQIEPSQEDEDECCAYQGEVTTRLMTISYRVSRWSF